MVESFTIVRKMLGWPPGNEIPVLMLTKAMTENIMASECELRVEPGILENVSENLPKNRDSDMYASSRRGDLGNIHKLYASRGICGIL